MFVQGILPGDPTTPGYPSLPGAPRVEPISIPKIPSIPISYQEAIPLLNALNGFGPSAKDFGERWQGGKLGHKGVKYNIGPSPPELVLNLVNEQEYVTNPLWNVIGIINGTFEDEVIVIGNHRDACKSLRNWYRVIPNQTLGIAGGAGDPNSGSATMNEIVRSFGAALEAGWKPLRTIVFASWDGEEYGLVGSTEWVEQYVPWLQSSAIAYLNVDVSARGTRFSSSASPLLNRDIYEITSLILSPNQTIPGQTVADVWDGHISTMGSGSDFTAFQDFAGIPSLDLGFGSGPEDPVYHYHSNYDSFHWMSEFCDPTFEYHTTATKILSLLVAKLVQDPVVALNTTDYATALTSYLNSVKQSEEGTLRPQTTADPGIFAPLEDAIADLLAAATKFDAGAAELSDILRDPEIIPSLASKHSSTLNVTGGDWLFSTLRAVNSKYKFFERQFLHPEGLDSRPWFKHVIFAPGKWTGYAGKTYPGLVEALDADDEEGVRRWAGVIEGNVRAAAELLEKEWKEDA